MIGKWEVKKTCSGVEIDDVEDSSWTGRYNCYLSSRVGQVDGLDIETEVQYG